MGKKYYGMYLGIVIQNNDPERGGKIKVYVPHINISVYDNWVQENEDKKFRFPGINLDSDLEKIIEPLKNILPWAECAMPLAGASGSGRYNAHTNVGSISDTARPGEFEPDQDYVKSKYSLNKDGIGEKPGAKYEKYDLKLNDAFQDAADGVNRPNVLSYNYTPDTYSNTPKGSFSIPNVGSHVWVFFKDGDPNEPVYWAVSYGRDDWRLIYNITDEDRGLDYPGIYENVSKGQDPSYTTDTETYRNKFVINQKGGVIEFVNSDNRELLRMTHYSGSFKEFNNYANVELASNNDQKLVLTDQYETVRGFKNSYVERDYDFIVRGDRYKKIGNLDVANMKQWRVLVSTIADVKQLFETKRANPNDWTSSLQAQDGTFAPCPVCNGSSSRIKSYPTISNSWSSVGKEGNVGTPAIDTFDCGGPGCPTVSERTGHNPHDGVTVEPKSYSPASSITGAGGGKIFGETCPACGGTGMSPSTMDGIWVPEERKVVSDFKKVILDTVEELVDVERELGLGGSEIITVTKHKTETIGTVMNDFGSIRSDVVGKMYNNKMVVHKEGVFENQKESPLIEYVHVDDLPGGSYNLNVCNKYTVQVGAGGLAMRSFGPVDMSGTVVNVAGEQVNVASQNEVNIDGGKRVSIVADIVSLRQRKQEQVIVDSSLGVSRNLICGGSAHFEGEVYLHHVTAPVEIQETENTKVYGRSNHEIRKIIGYLDDGEPDPFCMGRKTPPTPVYSMHGPKPEQGWYCQMHVADHDCTYMYPHSHHFKNLPLHLKRADDDVREAAKKCNETDRQKAEPREWVNALNKVTPGKAKSGGLGGLGDVGGAMSGGLGGGLGQLASAAKEAAGGPIGKAALNAATGGMGGPALAAGMTLAQGGSLEDAAMAGANEATGGMAGAVASGDVQGAASAYTGVG